MSIQITGTVVDDAGNGLRDQLVEARGDWLLTSDVIASTKTGTGGDFTLVLPGLVGEPNHPFSCQVRVVDPSGRPLCDDRDVPGTDGNQALGRITVRDADRTGLLVTNGKGEARMVSEGNAFEVLIDGTEAFGRTVEVIDAATTSVEMTQLFFGTPDFDPDTTKEHPHLIFAFGSPIVPLPPLPPSQQAPGVSRPDDRRPERVLLDAARRKVNIRVLLNEPTVSWPEGIFWLAVLTPVAAGLGVGAVGLFAALFAGVTFALLPVIIGATVLAYIAEALIVPWKLGKVSDVDELREYLTNGVTRTPPPRGDITVRPFRQPAPDNGVLHTKMVLADGQRATVLGSPFSQRYFDDPHHVIDNPHRGNTTADIVHDVSVGLVGPAVRDLHETFRLYWNEDQTPGNQIPSLPDIDVAPIQTSGVDGVVKAQVVRTLSAGRFSSLDGTSEKGILESYLRAFNSATRYIYLENQYFTDAIITEALKTVLKAKPGLELIIMINIKPDVMLYPGRQARLIREIRAAAPDRVGVFTRWTYADERPRAWVAPIYLHSKLGVIDDTWTTIGSANLDGLSLDHNLLLSPLTFGETTAAELNVTVVSGTAGSSGMAPAERVRRRLWAEHLGIFGPDGEPNPADTSLAMGGTTTWLPLWKASAKKALDHLVGGVQAPLPGFVLEYPKDPPTTARMHLAELGVPLDVPSPKIRPIGTTRAFDFFTGHWKLTNREDFIGASGRESP